MLIWLFSVKKIRNIEQVLGRIRRADNGLVVYFLDQNNICKSHWKVAHEHFSSVTNSIKQVHEIKSEYNDNDFEKITTSNTKKGKDTDAMRKELEQQTASIMRDVENL